METHFHEDSSFHVFCPKCGADLGIHDVSACSRPYEYEIQTIRDHQESFVDGHFVCPSVEEKAREEEVALKGQLLELLPTLVFKEGWGIEDILRQFLDAWGTIPPASEMPNDRQFPTIYPLGIDWNYSTVIALQDYYGRDHIKKIRRRIEDRLRKAYQWEIIDIASRLSIRLDI
jgi:hypothetical protein